MKPTIYQVAEKAGVSIATVSKVINDTGQISEATKVKVLKTMKELNYYPSVVASALTGKQTKTLGLLVPDISNPFFSELARNIEDRAHERDMSVIMCSTDLDPEREKKYIQLLQRKQVDGFIVSSGFRSKDLLNHLINNNVPLAMLAQDDPSYEATNVSVDDYRGGYEAVTHLLSKGHRHVAIIAEEVHSSSMRIYGYREAHANQGVPVLEQNIVRTTASIANGKKYIQELLKKQNRPTAVFACNDLIAVGIIQGAREAGIIIPEDLSIVGFDNTILATTTVPALTTVAQPIEEMGMKIVDVIIDQIEQPTKKNERILFMPKLMIRGTTTSILHDESKK